MSEDRHSRSVAEPLITDKLERAKRESENGLRQIDLVLERAGRHIGPNAEPFKLRPSLLLMLNRAAVEGIEATAGAFRTGRMEIFGSKHKPPIGADVPELVEELCHYVNERWSTASAAHLAAYVMWRINWIHPFDDGNGRTAPAASYLVLLAKTGSILPGAKTIPARIAASKNSYYFALEKADKAYAKDKAIDVSELEGIVVSALAGQLADVVMDARGG
ncbi:Fic family protein [Reyranella sp.]|uniref:Fic family protein n=1 Tax=Reyranella sp. TaxID=1929291 RepID=UPI004035313A